MFYNVLHLYRKIYNHMYLENVVSELHLKKTYRKLALKMHPDKGGSEVEFMQLAKEYRILKKKFDLRKNDFSKLVIGDTVFVNRTECEVTYVDEVSFIAKAKGRVKYAIFDKKTGVAKYNTNYRAALMREYFNR